MESKLLNNTLRLVSLNWHDVLKYTYMYTYLHNIVLLYRRVKGLKGKAAWNYQRSKSSSSVNSISHSPTPSPVVSPSPILNRDIQNLILDSELDQTSQSARHTPTKQGATVTPNSRSEQSDLDFPSLRPLSTPNLSIITSTPTSEASSELGSQFRCRTSAIGPIHVSSPLAQRRARSTSSIQKEALLSKGEKSSEEMCRDKRYSAVFATLR